MQNTQITIVVKLITTTEGQGLVKNEALKLINATRNEEGCINYYFHQDNMNPNIFLFYENWESRELWQIHMQNKNLKAYLTATDGLVERFELHEMTVCE